LLSIQSTDLKVLNALRMNTKHELEHAIDAIEKDDTILGVILTGCGRAFIAGSDISEINVDAKGGRKRLRDVFRSTYFCSISLKRSESRL
jgi:enoyl-CoA hydratase/carnithine racemase